MLIDYIDPVTAEVTQIPVPDNSAAFDYAALEVEARIVVQQRTDEIRTLLRRTAQDIVDIGGKLADVKARLDHGQFGAWLEHEFQWEERTAQRFMAVHARFKSDNLSDLAIAPSALYLLASPSVSDDTAQAVIERAQAGEAITWSAAKDAIRQARAIDEDTGEIVTAAHVRAVARINEALAAAPEAVREVVERFGVADADTISELTRLHKQRRETFAEVAASGFIQPGDEAEAVHIADGALAVKRALEDKAQTHRLLAADERAYPLTASNHISAGDGYDGDEWYTPTQYVEAARRVMGGIDLDPASTAFANETVRAETFYTQADDGLDQPWFGRVFCNPPYSQPKVAQFTERLIAEVEAGNVGQAILLVNNSTDTDWFQALLARFPACFTDGRVRFYRDSGQHFGTRQGQAFFYAGPNLDRFTAVFGAYGVIVRAVA